LTDLIKNFRWKKSLIVWDLECKQQKKLARRGRYSIGKTVIYDEDFLAFLCVYFVVQCVVLGDGGVGKTCLLMSYAQDRFPDDYTATGESTLLINEGILQTQIP
jgi:hypothetical protein